MSTSSIAKASRVDRACERLEAAVDRLETAILERPQAGTGDALQALERENAQLRDLNRSATEQLDGAIRKLERILAAPVGNSPENAAGQAED